MRRQPLRVICLMAGLAANYFPGVAAAQVQAGARCTFRSQLRPEIEIRWQYPGSPLGQWRGTLLVRGQPLRELFASRFQGYGSAVWGYSTGAGRSQPLLPFSGSTPTRGQPFEARAAVDRWLLVGLGADLYYTDQRSNIGLIRAAEGFWLQRPDCKGHFLFGRSER